MCYLFLYFCGGLCKPFLFGGGKESSSIIVYLLLTFVYAQSLILMMIQFIDQNVIIWLYKSLFEKENVTSNEDMLILSRM
jgi:hypothetical protein